MICLKTTGPHNPELCAHGTHAQSHCSPSPHFLLDHRLLESIPEKSPFPLCLPPVHTQYNVQRINSMSDSRSSHMNPQFTDGALSHGPKLPAFERPGTPASAFPGARLQCAQPKFTGNFYRTYLCRNGSNTGYLALCSQYHRRWKNLTENSVPVLNQEGQSTSPCVGLTQSHSWCSCP